MIGQIIFFALIHKKRGSDLTLLTFVHRLPEIVRASPGFWRFKFTKHKIFRHFWLRFRISKLNQHDQFLFSFLSAIFLVYCCSYDSTHLNASSQSAKSISSKTRTFNPSKLEFESTFNVQFLIIIFSELTHFYFLGKVMKFHGYHFLLLF